MDGPVLDTIRPETVGIDPVRLSGAVDVLKHGIDTQAMPGAVVCCFRKGKPFVHQALGTLDGTRPNSVETIYDLASVTKPMATAASLVRLLEAGKITLMQTMPEFFGEAAGQLANVTVGNLLTHTSGLEKHARLWEKGSRDLDSACAAILNLPTVPVGTRYEYSCLGFILLGKIVQQVAGQSLDRFAKENVFEPLGLKQTGYLPAAGLRERIAPTRSLEVLRDGETTETAHVGVVNDGNARSIGGVSGNAGLFGTVSDVARFGQAMLSGVPRLFATPTRARIFQNQVRPEIGAHTLLFFSQPHSWCPAGDLLSPRVVGHSGYTGNALAIDPEHELVIAVLTNRVYWDRDGSKWLTVRRKFFNAMAGAIL
jgi:CubicO group peptidase (beta-lactamase class C family)